MKRGDVTYGMNTFCQFDLRYIYIYHFSDFGSNTRTLDVFDDFTVKSFNRRLFICLSFFLSFRTWQSLSLTSLHPKVQVAQRAMPRSLSRQMEPRNALNMPRR